MKKFKFLILNSKLKKNITNLICEIFINEGERNFKLNIEILGF